MIEDVEAARGVVTSSVSFYAERLLAHHGVQYDVVTAWHDTSRHKPSPDPFPHAVKTLRVASADPT